MNDQPPAIPNIEEQPVVENPPDIVFKTETPKLAPFAILEGLDDRVAARQSIPVGDHQAPISAVPVPEQGGPEVLKFDPEGRIEYKGRKYHLLMAATLVPDADGADFRAAAYLAGHVVVPVATGRPWILEVHSCRIHDADYVMGEKMIFECLEASHVAFEEQEKQRDIQL